MTELQKKLLGEINNINDTITPSVKESSVETTEEGPRDEYNLTYNELIEEFIKFDKSAIMKESTWNRLWNS